MRNVKKPAQRVEPSASAPRIDIAALDFLEQIPNLLPGPHGERFLCALERAESGEPLDAAFGLPTYWRTRRRDALLQELNAAGLSPERIETLLRDPAGPFAETARRVLRLNGGQALGVRQIRNVTTGNFRS